MRRLTFLTVLLVLCITGFSQQYYLFVGTYTEGAASQGSKGIYVYKFDAATGNATPVSTVMTDNPSYLAVAPGGKYLYAANETGGSTPGAVSAFSFDKTTGALTLINQQPSGGNGPCYVSVDAHDKWVVVANYGGGSFSALPIGADGSVGAATQTIQHTGSGTDKSRQNKPHVHSVIFSPDGQYLTVADLGLDNLSIFKFDYTAAQSPMIPAATPTVSIKAVSGPRHTAFDPDKPYAYRLSEMAGAVDVFHYSKGNFTWLQRISSHPDGYTGVIGSADLHLGAGGKYLYASNRGDANNIAIFAIDPSTGKLTVKGFEPTQGKTPRNFMIDPTGKWLLVANQGGGNVVIFQIDPQTGLLKATGQQLQIPTPVCLKMTPAN
jgi:6-phosphogluconolactonase